jgi:hypothetical protein
MPKKPQEPKQQKTPKGLEIPVPKREDCLRDLKKAAQVKPADKGGKP